MIELAGVKKSYPDGEGAEQLVLDIEKLVIEKNSFIGITGSSGSGKSTLLNLIGLMDDFQFGIYRLAGKDVGLMSDRMKAKYRNKMIGFILQSYGLIDDLTVRENILLPTKFFKKEDSRDLDTNFSELINDLGIEDLLKKRPTQLSGGQKQRVGIARALINDPKIIIADEPTGNLDQTNSEQVLNILARKQKTGRTVILVSHEMDMLRLCDQVYRLLDGKIVLR